MASGDYIYDSYRSKMKRAVGHTLFEHFLPRTAGVNSDNGRLMYWIKDGNDWKTTENFGKVDLARDGYIVLHHKNHSHYRDLSMFFALILLI